MSTNDNLKAAFAGESQANRKYLAFAKKAEQDGYEGVARLFRAAAEAETLHAHAHLRVLGGINSTTENLQEAVDGEGYEFQTMYPQFLEEANEEGADRAAIVSFKHAMKAEEVHHNLYKMALEKVRNGEDLSGQSIYLCTVCGNIEIGEAPDECPICGVPKSKFVEIQ